MKRNCTFENCSSSYQRSINSIAKIASERMDGTKIHTIPVLSHLMSWIKAR